MSCRGIDAVAARLAPTGIVRASINLGNPVLAGIDPANGEPRGVSVDLARELGAQLAVAVELVVFETAGKAVEALTQERADVGFFAVDPERGAAIAFTAPYLLIEGCYLAREDSPLRDKGDVDRAGQVVVVGNGSAYDLHLSRELRLATIVRAPTSASVVDLFLAQGADVAAGVRQQLEADAPRVGGVRLLDGHFMVIRQAMATPSSRGHAAAQRLCRFVEEMKASGFVTRSLARHGIAGATVAPPQGGGSSG
ncbi:MAG TPA: ABC transporter substrate-binding protein [Caldimonas sp.]|nr:ABC transporter substrate-binding protein [Caldimonas sp.]HEX4233591.1 ABC transporter substrate-binding protein [Caldimonas sp.]